MASRLSGKVSISQPIGIWMHWTGRCEYLTILSIYNFISLFHSLASEISNLLGMKIVYMILLKLFTESWLDLTLSDPLRHSEAGSP